MRRTAISLLALGAALALPAHASAAQIVVGFKPGSTGLERAAALKAARAGTGVAIPRVDARVIRVRDAAAPAVLRALARQRAVRYAQRDAAAQATWTPNDPHLGSQWGLAKVRATSAWDGALGSSVLIADVDSGVDYNHPDLAAKVVLGYDYVAGDADPYDEHGHGTHVGGIAAAITDNATGVAGMAPSARILAVRVLDANGSGYMSNVAKGVIYSADKGARVINLSLGGSSGSTALLDAVNYAVAKGAIVACAAGNDGTSSLSYPARYDGCTSVAATDSSDVKASFSNWGSGLDLSAPGVGILSTVRGGGYQSWSGTSMATPIVSGLAALLYSQGLDRSSVLSKMTSTATDLGASGYDTTYGYGRIDAAAAVAASVGTTPTPVGNATPSCSDLSVRVKRNSSVSLAMSCSDADGQVLTYSLLSQPTNGTLSEFDSAKGTVTYKPRRHYRGSDSFTYTATDGSATAPSATVSIKVG